MGQYAEPSGLPLRCQLFHHNLIKIGKRQYRNPIYLAKENGVNKMLFSLEYCMMQNVNDG
jgi:hypothetical protein